MATKKPPKTRKDHPDPKLRTPKIRTFVKRPKPDPEPAPEPEPQPEE